jgi:hypothetical protein
MERLLFIYNSWGRHGRDSMVDGFIDTYLSNVYHDLDCEFEPRSGELHSMEHDVIKFVSDLSVTCDRSVKNLNVVVVLNLGSV